MTYSGGDSASAENPSDSSRAPYGRIPLPSPPLRFGIAPYCLFRQYRIVPRPHGGLDFEEL